MKVTCNSRVMPCGAGGGSWFYVYEPHSEVMDVSLELSLQEVDTIRGVLEKGGVIALPFFGALNGGGGHVGLVISKQWGVYGDLVKVLRRRQLQILKGG